MHEFGNVCTVYRTYNKITVKTSTADSSGVLLYEETGGEATLLLGYTSRPEEEPKYGRTYHSSYPTTFWWLMLEKVICY
jgi:hypothetical protein